MTEVHHVETVAPERWVARAVDVFAMAINAAVEARGRCVVGLSGGSTPAPVFEALAQRALPWDKVVFVQIDERVAPLGTPERNLTAQLEALGALPARWIPLPIEEPLGTTSEAALAGFVADLEDVAGEPPVLDLVHLGLGSDGHTASLLPGDPALEITDRDVAETGVYQGTRRLTLTRPVIDRARLVVWLVRGESKVDALAKLIAIDQTSPAGLIRPRHSVIVADSSAHPVD